MVLLFLLLKSNMRKLALHVDPLDNVATVFFNDCKDGTEVEVSNKDGSIEKIKCIGDVPFGHKIAYTEIKKGEKIMKYGECIGGALRDIKKGEYVHVHNLEALRGRGDK